MDILAHCQNITSPSPAGKSKQCSRWWSMSESATAKLERCRSVTSIITIIVLLIWCNTNSVWNRLLPLCWLFLTESQDRWDLTTKILWIAALTSEGGISLHEQGGVELPLSAACTARFLWRILCTVLNWCSTAPTSSLSAAADGLSSTPTAQSPTPPHHSSPTEGKALLTRDPLTAFSSQPAHTAQDTSSAAPASTLQPQSESLTAAQPTTTGHPLTSAQGQVPAGPTHREVPSELNVGDEGKGMSRWERFILGLLDLLYYVFPFSCHLDLKGPRYRSSSPLDPLLAGLLSVFIVTTAIVFVILFLKFRQRTNHPEFHRLQDLPMVRYTLLCIHVLQ